MTIKISPRIANRNENNQTSYYKCVNQIYVKNDQLFYFYKKINIILYNNKIYLTYTSKMTELNKKWLKKLRTKQALLLEGQFEHGKVFAKDVMINPTFLHLDDNIEIILEKLKSEEINYCIVVDNYKKFIWEVTDEMLLKIIAHTSSNEPLCEILDIGYKRWINYTNTKDYVKKHKNIVTEWTTLFEIMKLIDKKGFQFIPVVDDEKKIIWVITPSSIIKFIISR